MRMDICDLNKFIRVNNLQEVTNPITLDVGYYPTENGLLSYSIFGLSGSYDRKTIFAYIDLKKKFLHPLIYIMIRQMDHNFTKVVNSTEYFRIENGKLVKDPENGNTGLEWLYKHFDELEFRKTGKSRRDNKVDILSTLSKNELFVDKWLVIPAFYRDINLAKKSSGKPKLDDINKLYSRLLNLCQSSSSEFDVMGNITTANIQNTLEEIFEYLTGYVKRKEGLIKTNLLGKTVDYSTRGVISASRINTNRANQVQVKFGYVGLPLSHICNLFYPYFCYEIEKWAEDVFLNVNEIYNIHSQSYYKIVDGMENFSQDKIKKMLSLYIKSPANRLDPIMVKVRDPKTNKISETPLALYKDKLHRNFTILDLLFIVAHKVVADKHVYITRYPVENFQSIYPARITIMTTYETQEMDLPIKHFDDYPVIPDGEKAPVTANSHTNFIDTILLHNSSLTSLGADYDGRGTKLSRKYLIF